MALPTSATMCAHEEKGTPYYAFPALDAIPFLRHGFSTRLGGVSEGIYTSMNLSFTNGDEHDRVMENFRRIGSAIGIPPERIVLSRQTHTTNIRRVTAADVGCGITRDRTYDNIDGLVTDEPEVALCTLYADCVPLFFADPVRRVIAVAHSGWRGTAAGMGRVMVEAMARDYGCRPEDIVTGIGPSIGFCCFEVDTPVYEAFAPLPFFDEGCFVENGGGKYHLNLQEINRRILLSAGVRPEHITVGDLCTQCHADTLWSHRATGGKRGSLAGLIMMTRD